MSLPYAFHIRMAESPVNGEEAGLGARPGRCRGYLIVRGGGCLIPGPPSGVRCRRAGHTVLLRQLLPAWISLSEHATNGPTF